LLQVFAHAGRFDAFKPNGDLIAGTAKTRHGQPTVAGA
jgi:hypothetical protein